MGVLVERGLPCVASSPTKWEEECTSSDALALYLEEDEDGKEFYAARCYSCEQSFSNNRLANTEIADMFGIVKLEEERVEDSVQNRKAIKKKPKSLINREQIAEIRAKTKDVHEKFRDIEDKYHNLYGIRSEYNELDTMVARHYPNTKDGIPSSYRARVLPKDFSRGAVGYEGKENDLFGAVRFKEGGKYLCIVGGQEDCPAAYKMLREEQENRNREHIPPIAVVSPTVGESSAAEQIKSNYDFVNKFEIIVICMDNDSAGWKAVDKIMEVLPPGKGRVMTCPIKDPCEALKKGKEAAFVRNFYSAKEHLAKGVTGSGDIAIKMREEMAIERLTLPPFMCELQEMMGGGIPLGRIICFASGSGSGKTTIINEMIYYWIFNSPHKIGVMSLELDEGEYGVAMLSRHLGRKINLIKDVDERLAYLDSPTVKRKEHELLYKEGGSHRWMMVDEGDGGIEETQKRIMNLIIQHDCKVIVLDPLSDLFDDLNTEQQAQHMRWQKRVVKKYKVDIINILHVRKSGQGEKANSSGRMLHEEDMHGSSSVYKSSAANILFSRDKYAESEEERNTLDVWMPKCRWTGNGGHAGQWYYDLQTHTLHDKVAYMGATVIEDSETSSPAILDGQEAEIVYSMEEE